MIQANFNEHRRATHHQCVAPSFYKCGKEKRNWHHSGALASLQYATRHNAAEWE